MDNRYSDVNDYGDVTYKEIIWRITHGIEKRPVCQICGSPVKFRPSNTISEMIKGYENTCSKKCRYELSTINMMKTMNEKYNCSTNLMLPEIKKKAVEGFTKKSSDSRKKTMIERYGVESNFKIPSVRKKAIDSFSDFIHHKSKIYDQLKQYLINNPDVSVDELRTDEKFSEMIETYDYFMNKNNHSDETKKKNGFNGMSKAEKNILELLKSKYNVIFNEKHKGRYEHKCDFYIKELDLFIEYQGNITHNQEPYVVDDFACKNKLEKLNINIQYAINIKGIKTNKSNYYATLKTWTISDVNKRNEAKRNGLNYLEIYPKFDINDVLKFIEKYYPQ